MEDVAKGTDLLNRIKAATGPDWSLDVEIARALGFLEEVAGMVRLPAYTASLDAALTLVPEGLEWELFGYDATRDPRFPRFQARIMLLTHAQDPEELGPQSIMNAATPALALCAAALRAHEAMKDNDDG